MQVVDRNGNTAISSCIYKFNCYQYVTEESTDVMRFMRRGRGDNLDRRNIILAVLHTFHKMGREEISLSEFLECIKNIQEEIPLKYEFFERLLYSSDLMEELRDLEFQGFAHRYIYRHDAFIPKSYIYLTTYGKFHAQKITEKIPKKLIPIINRCVSQAIKSYQDTWNLYARSTQ